MSELVKVVAEVFDVPESSLSCETERGSIENWDSLGHLRLVAAIEERFKVSIPMEEVNKITFLKDFKKFITKEEKK